MRYSPYFAVLLCVLIAWAASACAPAPTPVVPGATVTIATPTNATAPAEQNVRLGQDFTLRVGQSAVIADEGFRVRFVSLLSDSRCPRNVACVWAGQAQISVVARHIDDESPALTLTIVGEQPQNDTRLAKWSGYTVEFKALTPYPGDEKANSEPEARLMVSKP